jgi:hypothetical protein
LFKKLLNCLFMNYSLKYEIQANLDFDHACPPVRRG